MVEGIQLVDIGQVTVNGAPTSIELLELCSPGGGGLGILVGMEVGNTFGRQLAGLPVLVIEELPDLIHHLHPLDVGPDVLWHTVPDSKLLLGGLEVAVHCLRPVRLECRVIPQLARFEDR